MEEDNVQDHRKIGTKIKIFDFDEMMGSGLPIWMENGLILKNIITEHINRIQKNHNIKLVSTPELGKRELYERSGHLNHYQENIFPEIKENDENSYVLRPMTCPHHILLYKKNRWHEKQLPIAFGENSKLYRYEYSGGLFGLERTRCMELIDTHFFCSENQIFQALQTSLDIILEVKKNFEISHEEIVFAVRDKDKSKFYDDDELWEKSEGIIRNFLDKNRINYTIGVGDAAFYGPKIDFQIKTKSQKIITISTIQLDFILPKKFELSYKIGEEGVEKTPIMIHLGIIGTLERFIAYLLEKNNGWLPFWLSPIQIAIFPINSDQHLEYAKKLQKFYETLNIRTWINDKNEKLGKKIINARDNRIYGYIVVGDKEIEKIKNMNLSDKLKTAENNLNRKISQIEINKHIDPLFPENHTDLIRWLAANNE